MSDTEFKNVLVIGFNKKTVESANFFLKKPKTFDEIIEMMESELSTVDNIVVVKDNQVVKEWTSNDVSEDEDEEDEDEEVWNASDDDSDDED